MTNKKRRSTMNTGERIKSAGKKFKKSVLSAKDKAGTKLSSARDRAGKAASSARNSATNVKRSVESSVASGAKYAVFSGFFNVANPFTKKISKLLKQLAGMKHSHAKLKALNLFKEGGTSDRKGVMYLLFVLMAENLHVKLSGITTEEDKRNEKNNKENINNAIGDTARLLFDSGKHGILISFAELTREEKSEIEKNTSKAQTGKEPDNSDDDNSGVILTAKAFSHFVDYVYSVLDNHNNEKARIIYDLLSQSKNNIISPATMITTLFLLLRGENPARIHLDNESNGIDKLFKELSEKVDALNAAKEEGFDNSNHKADLDNEIQNVLSQFSDYSMTLSFKSF